MSTKETGGPAFPLAVGWVETDMKTGHKTVVDVRDLDRGLSLRDYLAAKALPVAWKAFEDGYFGSGEDSINEDVAACAYQMADAMLKERAK